MTRFMHAPRSWVALPLTAAIAAATSCGGAPLPGDGPGSPAERCDTGTDSGNTTVSYTQHIRPIIERSGCLSAGCHGPLLQSRFSLQSYDSMFTPGTEAQAFDLCPVVPGRPDESYILEKLRANPRSGQRMPKDLPALAEEDIAMFETWISEGAANN